MPSVPAMVHRSRTGRRTRFLFNLEHAAAAPRLRIDDVEVTHVEHGFHRVRAEVSNHGYLPTNLTDVALENGVADPVRVSLELMAGVHSGRSGLAPRSPWSGWFEPPRGRRSTCG
jgi:hypothetical protein